MIQLATCSYAGRREHMGTPVRITLGQPRWPRPPGRERWPFLAELSPRPAYFRRSRETFTAAYLAQLDRLADDIERKFGWLADRFDGPAVLCCFERGPLTDDNWCHRRLAAAWLSDRLGIEIPELDGR